MTTTQAAPTPLLTMNCRSDPGWLELALEALRHAGCVVVSGVLDAEQVDAVRDALYGAQAGIHREIGLERLERAGEIGVLRAPMRYAPELLGLLEVPEILAIVDRTVSETAILHLQNGFILPPQDTVISEASFQQSFHMDFPRYLNGYLASLNVLVAVDSFTSDNGGTLVVPGTHQRAGRPNDAYLARMASPVECPAGSIIVFDSTLWHAAGRNRSGRDRLGVNMQFTRSFLKQQIDYVRCLGDDVVLAQPGRTQQLLGWYTRVVTSLDEYYRPGSERLYRSGQG
jgi:ectoine hydroxylase-related dioxygenase (phytanoyl-CoA dioxygenase family)